MTCLICFDDEVQVSDGGVECGRGHFYCASCFERTACDELDQIANCSEMAAAHHGREGKLRCPRRCGELFTDHQLANCLEVTTFSRYQRLRDEGYAERVRMQAEIDTRRRIEREREQGEAKRRNQENAQSMQLIENEIRDGKMKRCPNCSTGIKKNLGCDHMHCRTAGGCGANFCFACEAIPSYRVKCPGSGMPHTG
jgi:hypothetical protein